METRHGPNGELHLLLTVGEHLTEAPGCCQCNFWLQLPPLETNLLLYEHCCYISDDADALVLPVHIEVYTCVQVFLYIHIYMHITYKHTYIHTNIRTYVHTYMHACMHACMCIYIYIYGWMHGTEIGVSCSMRSCLPCPLCNHWCRSTAWFAQMLWKHLLHLYRQPTSEDVDLARDVRCKLAILCMPYGGLRILFQTLAAMQ